MLQRIATATPSSEEDDDDAKALEDEIKDCQKAKKEIVESALPFSEELAKIAQREEECRVKLHRLRPKEKQQHVQ